MLWELQTQSSGNRSGRWIETRLHQLSNQITHFLISCFSPVVYVQLIRSVIPTDLLVINRIQDVKGVGEGVVISCPVHPVLISFLLRLILEFILVRRLA